MRISSPRLRRLDNALANFPDDSEAMLLSELDGYVAGVIVCPSPIAPSEWLPLVWSSDGQTSPFADEYDAKWYADTVIEHHDAVARALTRGEGRYAPFFEIDARHDEIMWELWIAGFEAAMILRPASWNRIAESGDERAAAAIAGITTLVRIANDESDLDRAIIDQLTEEAPGLIPEWVATLNAWRSEHGTAAPATSETPAPAKLGRNDPCACGSGRKYKKCCGAC